MPPIQYLAHVRAHRLTELLVETDLPIGVAMTQVGWRSRGHAARQFTAIIGVSPSAYRLTATQRASLKCPCCGQRREPATEHSGLLGPTRTEFRDTVIRMRADLVHRWTLAELAQDAHLSRSRLGGLFVEQFGVPPIMLLARLRVREMARLLRESDMTVDQIGVRVGWRNRGHAAEQFAKTMGVTPTAYRAEYRQRTRQAADDLTGCLWCGQPLPTTDDDRKTRRSDGDPLIHG